MKKNKVLFVCLGNICRSPLAEAIFKHKLAQRRLTKHFEVDSCGTSDYHIGEDPDERTVENARKNGVSISHKGRQLSGDDLDYYDLILAMDRSNLLNTVRLVRKKEHQAKIRLMRDFDVKNPGSDVPDPYYGGPKGFQDVFDILDRSCDNLLTQLESNLD